MIRAKSKSTRSVHFAATSQLILLPNINRGWYSRSDKTRFERETAQHAKQMRSILARGSDDDGSVCPNDLSEDDLIHCTGIEPLVLCSLRNLRQLQRMKLAHTDVILAAQRHLTPSELSLVSRRSSNGARKRAYILASLQSSKALGEVMKN